MEKIQCRSDIQFGNLLLAVVMFHVTNFTELIFRNCNDGLTTVSLISAGRSKIRSIIKNRNKGSCGLAVLLIR